MELEMTAAIHTLLVDMDHTLSNASWRDGMLGGDWDEYHAASAHDSCNIELALMVNSLRLSTFMPWSVIGFTARPEKWRKLTMDWLIRNCCELDELLMRPNDDYRIAPLCKVDQLKRRFGKDLLPLKNGHTLIIDDDERNIVAMRGLGLTTLHITTKVR